MNDRIIRSKEDVIDEMKQIDYGKVNYILDGERLSSKKYILENKMKKDDIKASHQ